MKKKKKKSHWSVSIFDALRSNGNVLAFEEMRWGKEERKKKRDDRKLHGNEQKLESRARGFKRAYLIVLVSPRFSCRIKIRALVSSDIKELNRMETRG